jgi:biopolymer transport protein ExbB/TolQ
MNLFYMGGVLFMSLLTIAFATMVAVSIIQLIKIQKGEAPFHLDDLKLVQEIGLLALVLGILGQFIGLFEAFKAIESMGEVSPGMLAAGLKVSSITTIYGLVIYSFSLLSYFFLRWSMSRSFLDLNS